MILLIHQNDVDSLKYLSFLKKRNIDYIDISLSNLIKKVQVNSEIKQDKNVISFNSVWKFNNKVISINDLKGVLFNFPALPESIFEVYQKEDESYAKNEWWAYLVYLFSSHHNCINKLTLSRLSLTNFSYINLYSLAKKNGFKVPFHKIIDNISIFPSNFDAREYYLKKSLYDIVDYSYPKNLTEQVYNFAIERINGAQILSYVVNSKVVSKIYFSDKNESIKLPEKINKKIVNFVNDLDLQLAELMFVLTKDNNLYFYHMNPYPNLKFIDGNDKQFFWEELTSILLGE